MGTLINDYDQCFLDSIAQEVNCLAGITAEFFQFEEPESSRDPYYQEPVHKVFKKDGIEIPILFKSPQRSPVSGEEGFRIEKSATFFVARKDLDKHKLGRPRVGDLLKVWGRYYEITQSSATEGRFSDTGLTTSYEITCVRRTQETPESVDLDPQVETP